MLDLLVAMGYGGSRKEAAAVTQKTGDEGIDGVTNEDRLGLDVIYLQAKRWKANVGRPEIQNFVGALAGKKASKGVFITTSAFHENARDYAAALHQKVILIDGRRLAELMIEHGIGVRGRARLPRQEDRQRLVRRGLIRQLLGVQHASLWRASKN